MFDGYKTFLCNEGVCEYQVGLRVQDATGSYNDTFLPITVRSESEEWPPENTVCVSNSLDAASDWTAYDKACPEGATKQSFFPDADDYNNKLVLVKKAICSSKTSRNGQVNQTLKSAFLVITTK